MWIRRAYNLAPTDPRFLALTPFDILTEYYAHHYDDRLRAGKSIIESEDDDFDLAAELEKINAEAAKHDDKKDDAEPVTDDWEVLIDER